MANKVVTFAVEPATYLDGLDPAIPVSTGRIIEADNHMRLIKTVVKNTFPGFVGNGFNKPITATETEISFTEGLLSNLQGQIDALSAGEVPIGGVIPYFGALSSVPSNYNLCDGTNGTPNLADTFIWGATGDTDVGDTGGSPDAENPSHTHTQSHNHSGTTSYSPKHTHGLTIQGNVGFDYGAYTAASTQNPLSLVSTTSVSPTHNHTAAISYTGNLSAGSAGTGLNLPPYVKLAYIRRMT